ncbi:uncharacterized protein OCT59_029265 [Rhizophagus irregularis]|uniref:uncharacterized protein n=1 Tax=Rhizophagus irregularis TaxID=588596 RepID=UPI003318F833|nr:hypothetical protein OCT59_029265 [Rhizophagus irregularis]
MQPEILNIINTTRFSKNVVIISIISYFLFRICFLPFKEILSLACNSYYKCFLGSAIFPYWLFGFFNYLSALFYYWTFFIY